LTELKKFVRKERRGKLEIYFDILRSIESDSHSFDGVRPTRIQQQSNLSYDKFARYLKDLEDKTMIIRWPSISLSNKGKVFINEYKGIKEFIEKMGLDYL